MSDVCPADVVFHRLSDVEFVAGGSAPQLAVYTWVRERYYQVVTYRPGQLDSIEYLIPQYMIIIQHPIYTLSIYTHDIYTVG